MSADVRIPAEPDRVHGRAILAVAAGGVAVTLASLAVVAALLPPRPTAAPTRVAPPHLGRVAQTLIESDGSARAQRDRARRSLDTLGWVDRDAGTAHIPIARAIDLVVQREGAR